MALQIGLAKVSGARDEIDHNYIPSLKEVLADSLFYMNEMRKDYFKTASIESAKKSANSGS